MSSASPTQPVVASENRTYRAGDRELVLVRTFNAPREKVYRAWAEPELMKQWFCPRPWTTPVVETELRAGGASKVIMRSPEGQEFPNRGVYLEVVPNERLVFTDAYVSAWQPSEKPFMTVIVTFEPAAGGRTKYTARVLHWSAADCDTHEKMGFHDGWSKAADQLEEVLKTL